MSDAPLIRLIRAEMQRFTGREYQIAFDQFDARSLQELLRFLIDAEYKHYGFVTQDLKQALPERSEPKHALVLIGRQNDEDRTYRRLAPRPAKRAANSLPKAS